jgi:hypothetical protein
MTILFDNLTCYRLYFDITQSQMRTGLDPSGDVASSFVSKWAAAHHLHLAIRSQPGHMSNSYLMLLRLQKLEIGIRDCGTAGEFGSQDG